jgi:hypothetical protein
MQNMKCSKFDGIITKIKIKLQDTGYCQLINVHSVSDIRQVEVHTAETLVLGPSHLEV